MNDRDIALVLLGIALTQSERTRILSAVQAGALPDEVDVLLNSLREQRKTAIIEWLKKRGVVISKGKDAVQAIVDHTVAKHKTKLARQIVSELSCAVRLEDEPALKDRLRDCLQRLESV